MLRAFVFRLLRLCLVPDVIRETIQRRRVTILLYHNPDVDAFQTHLAALGGRYSIISLRDFLASREGSRINRLPPKSLVLTFDDGHRANYKLAPVLARELVPVTIFVCSGIVGTNRRFWFKYATNNERLKRIPDDARVAELRAMGFIESSETEEREALSDLEIISMREVLVEFQSHTVSHPILPRCSAEKASREIGHSRLELERRYGQAIWALAYPNGEYSDREVCLARQAGYSCAVTVDHGFNSSSTDLFRLKRICIDDGDGVDELIVKASGLWGVVRILLPMRRHRELSGVGSIVCNYLSQTRTRLRASIDQSSTGR